MMGFGSKRGRTNKRLTQAHDAISQDIDRLSAAISQADGQRAILIKKAAASPGHEQKRIALTVRQLDRDQDRRRQRLVDLQRQQNILTERMGQLEQEKTVDHRKRLDKLVGDMDEFAMEAEEQALAAEEDRAYLQDIDETLDQTVGTSSVDDKTDSILDEINVQKEIMEDERSGRIKARLQDQGNEEVTAERASPQKERRREESY